MKRGHQKSARFRKLGHSKWAGFRKQRHPKRAIIQMKKGLHIFFFINVFFLYVFLKSFLMANKCSKSAGNQYKVSVITIKDSKHTLSLDECTMF